MVEELILKWGTIKGWSNLNEDGPAFDAVKRLHELGVSMSAAMQRDTPEQKAIVCEAIDALENDKVYLEWDDEYVSKEEAKAYVMDYRS